MTRAGQTRITPAALKHTVETIAASAFGVPRPNAAAALEDDSGRLAATVSVQLPLPQPLGRQGMGGQGQDGGTVFDRARPAPGGPWRESPRSSWRPG